MWWPDLFVFRSSRHWRSLAGTVVATAAIGALVVPAHPRAQSGQIIDVPSGGNLQQALNSVQPGGTVRLASGATFVGSFKLPLKTLTDSSCSATAVSPPASCYILITTNTALPPAGTRIDPTYKARLATIRSDTTISALVTAAGVSYYRIVGVAFEANKNGAGDIIALGRSDQTTLQRDSAPHRTGPGIDDRPPDARAEAGDLSECGESVDHQLRYSRDQGRRAGLASHLWLEHAGPNRHPQQLSGSGWREHHVRRRWNRHPQRCPERHHDRKQLFDEESCVAGDIVDGEEPVRIEERAAGARPSQHHAVQLERRTDRLRDRAHAAEFERQESVGDRR